MSADPNNCPGDVAERAVLSAIPVGTRASASAETRLASCPECRLTCLPISGAIPIHPNCQTGGAGSCLGSGLAIS